MVNVDAKWGDHSINIGKGLIIHDGRGSWCWLSSTKEDEILACMDGLRH
jgi:hypothetical protein